MRSDSKREAERWLGQAEKEWSDVRFLSQFETLKNARRLDEYYIPTQYPNGLPGDIPFLHYDDREQVETALELCESVLNLVKKNIICE